MSLLILLISRLIGSVGVRKRLSSGLGGFRAGGGPVEDEGLAVRRGFYAYPSGGDPLLSQLLIGDAGYLLRGGQRLLGRHDQEPIGRVGVFRGEVDRANQNLGRRSVGRRLPGRIEKGPGERDARDRQD